VQVTANHQTFEFDEVIFACHGDETLAMLSDANDAETSALSAFGYQKNIAYLHRDTRQMPKTRANWSSWNYLLSDLKSADCTVTYWMNSLQGIDEQYPLFVTLNPITPIAPDKIFDMHEFMHPVFTTAAIAAQPEIQKLEGERNTWFCGAHLGYGFHEDGLQSAIKIIRKMGITIPWL
jgi:predicted NAD/FAD-binding protein